MAELHAVWKTRQKKNWALRMRNAETAYNVKTFHQRSLMFARNYQRSKHAIFCNFKSGEWNLRGETLKQPMLRGLSPIVYVAKTHI